MGSRVRGDDAKLSAPGGLSVSQVVTGKPCSDRILVIEDDVDAQCNEILLNLVFWRVEERRRILLVN